VKSHPFLSRLVQPLYREYCVQMSKWPIRGPIPEFSGDRRLQVIKLRNFDDYSIWAEEHAVELAERTRVEESLFPPTATAFSIPGMCALCGRATSFSSTFEHAIKGADGRLIPNLREHLNCTYCGFKNRVRAALHLFVQEFEPEVKQPIYISEQLTTTFRWMKGHYSSVSGSEYLPEEGAFGKKMRGIRNENLQALSWPDEQFDFVLSLDVLEHVAEATACFREIHRCLRPGGRLLFTAPTVLNQRETIVRATLRSNGEIVHFMEPEYHGGNRRDASKGTLCFRYFGWDVLPQLEELGFSNAEMWLYWSRDLGYMGGTQIALTAFKA
jgi:SAM-dependent methyltransferase